MALMDGYRRLLQGIGRRPARDVHNEIELHLRLTTEELIGGGMSPDAAEAEARRRFGNAKDVEGELRRVQRQIQRRESTLTYLEGVRGDVKFALRTLWRRPGFAVFAIGTLALGIGGATAIFSVANGVFLKPLPGVRDSDRIVELTQGHGGDFKSISYPVFRALSDGVDELAYVGATDILTVAIGNGDDVPLVTMGLQVTDGYFETLGTRPAIGRLFSAPEASFPDPAAVAVVSHSLWERRFASDPDIVGRTVRFNGSPLRVIGVTEEGFHGHATALQLDVFVPVGADVPGVHGAASLEYHRSGQLDLIAKLAPGATLDQARAAADALSNQYVQAIEGPEATYPLRMIPYGSVPGMARTGVAAFLGILLLVTILVLGITCVNITNLQLSRAALRGREIAVRMSLGAGKGRIVRQLLIESMVVFAFGAALGTLLATWAVGLASGFQPSIPLPGARFALDLAIDYRVLLFALGLTVLAGLFSGLVPGWHVARQDPVAGLRDGLNATSGRQRARAVLLVAQVAATVVLLVVAGLFLRSFQASQQVDVGFDSRNVVVAGFDMELAGYDATQGALFWQSLLERVEAIAEVESASLAHKLPISSRSQWSVNAPGVQAPEGAHGFVLSNRRVSIDYFETLGFRIVRGRGFAEEDVAGAPRVMVINETMAERVWPGQNPIGRILDNGRDQFEVVGIAADAVYHDLHEPVPGFGFLPLEQNYNQQMILHARLRSDDGAAVKRLQETLRGLDPLVPVMNFARLDDSLQIRFLGDLFGASLSASFGTLGLLLAVFGVYGVTSFWAAQRRGEIGIRLALGATRSGVVRWTVRRCLLAPGVGMLVGLVFALGVARLLSSLLSGISAFDPTTFVAVGVVLTFTGLLATWLPAWAAARVPPAETLRAL